MGKLTISMAIFKSYVSLPEGILKKGTKMRGNPKISWEMGTIKQKSHGMSWGPPLMIFTSGRASEGMALNMGGNLRHDLKKI